MLETIIELRSDTFTKPTPEMLQEMIKAEVGDAVYDEDPTVTKLEERVSELFGKEAALFVPSGTMANLIAVMVHCNERGSEIIVGDISHYNLWEQGGVSQIGNVYAKQIPNNEDGTFDLEKFESLISDHTDCHCSRTRLVCIENTHNHCGGKVLPIEFIRDLRKICDKYDIRIHLDGSRVMNASLASGLSVKEISDGCDSVNFCFSKGLGAPVGSVLIGSKKFIEMAKRTRKVLGGSMRQVGILAGACLYALDKANENLLKDHENAIKLAEGINGQGLLEVQKPETNIIHLKLGPKIKIADFVNRLKTVNESEVNRLGGVIKVNAGESDIKTIRLLSNLNVTTNQIDLAIKKINCVIEEFL
ncbi:unnamed protein product [Brachionus calyciflorus]|uniref:Aromatic amino acid beta-eliminating lyase/threonine aldolase domain-containing protein n=1 Tax=Brachionus calyciflorus TaxID=104777 RepID=A0A813Z3T4_9BILA|nr:unnamed protein product [Brachionus calyciflorus]